MKHAAVPAASPEKRLRTVLQFAAFDALSLAVVAGPAALVSLALREWFAAAIGAGIVACAALEWSGRRRLRRGDRAGLHWMAAAQLGCLTLILLYANHLAHQPASDRILALLPAFSRAQLDELFPDPESLQALLLTLQHLVASAVALVALFCQGGLALYYLRSRSVLTREAATPPLLPSDSPPPPPLS